MNLRSYMKLLFIHRKHPTCSHALLSELVLSLASGPNSSRAVGIFGGVAQVSKEVAGFLLEDLEVHQVHPKHPTQMTQHQFPPVLSRPERLPFRSFRSHLQITNRFHVDGQEKVAQGHWCWLSCPNPITRF